MHVKAALDVLGWNGSLHSYEVTSFAKQEATAVFAPDTALSSVCLRRLDTN